MRFIHQFEYMSDNWQLACKRAKTKPCRFCNCSGCIKNHGFLRGVHPDKHLLEIRGIRFLCSDRHGNKGCGRTFSLLFNHILPRHSTRSTNLSDFFDTLLNFNNVHAALYHSAVPFSLRTAYAWLKKLKNSQAVIRSNIRAVPYDHLGITQAPHLTTIGLIRKLSRLSNDYIANYQQRHQTAFFLPKSTIQSS